MASDQCSDDDHRRERTRSRSRSVSDPPQLQNQVLLSPSGEDIKMQSHLRLEQELSRVKEELKLKDEEVDKLSRVRDQVVEELDELTSSLFQEAYAMVDKAKEEKAIAEKKLIESQNKVDVLEAEVIALKTIIRPSQQPLPIGKSTQSKPRSSSTKNPPGTPSHRRTSSLPVATDTDSVLQLLPSDTKRLPDASSLNPVDFQLFSDWLKLPSLNDDDPFMSLCHNDDVRPCMKFPNKEFADEALTAIQKNTISIEAVLSDKTGCFDAPSLCALFGAVPKPCGFRLRLTDSSNWQFISRRARNRIISVCDLYAYLRYIQLGIVKNDVHAMFQEVMQLRAEIALSRLGMTAMLRKGPQQ